jgi:preprotein translocase subunit YajC
MYYFMLLRPTKKRDTELKKMRDSLQAGDRVITIGGIVGRIISTKEETVVIETGADKTKLQFTKWAISQKENSSED